MPHSTDFDSDLALTNTGMPKGGRNKVSNKKPGLKLHPFSDDPDDPHDPRGPDFEPRPHPDESGDKWAFGKVHAALHHVLDESQEGNVTSVVDTLDAFSAAHSLGLSLGRARGDVVENAVRKATNRSTIAIRSSPESESNATSARRALNLLVLGAGIGSGTLRCLPPLLEGVYDGPHEIVSVEGNVHRSDAGAQLLRHALGDGREDDAVRHLPLMSADDTTLPEILDSLMGVNGYDVGPFDVVLLEGRARDLHLQQLQHLINKRALRDGAVVHAEGPGRGDADTEKFLALLDAGHRGARFDYEVREVWPGVAAVVATHQSSGIKTDGRDSEL